VTKTVVITVVGAGPPGRLLVLLIFVELLVFVDERVTVTIVVMVLVVAGSLQEVRI
jgi:hypothetical protein